MSRVGVTRRANLPAGQNARAMRKGDAGMSTNGDRPFADQSTKALALVLWAQRMIGLCPTGADLLLRLGLEEELASRGVDVADDAQLDQLAMGYFFWED